MKIRLTLIFTAVILFANIFLSCCEEKEYQKFEGMNIKTFERVSGSFQTYQEGRHIQPNVLGFAISFISSYYGTANTFINNLYATENCDHGQKGSQESITEISIKSSAGIDEQHKAGDELKDLFIYKQQVYLEGQQPDTAYKPLDKNYFELLQRNIFVNNIIELNKKTVLDSVHIFTVAIKLSDGREFKSETPAIKFR